jgi:ankyrin repeat protein
MRSLLLFSVSSPSLFPSCSDYLRVPFVRLFLLTLSSQTPLLVASEQGNVSMVRLLMSLGANPNIANKSSVV